MTSRRRSNRDHACLVRFLGEETSPERIRKKNHQPGVEDEIIAAQLEALLTPAIFNQSHYYRQLGLRNRLLNLPLMMAAVLTLLWRNVPGVRELSRMLGREGFLWCEPTQVSQQAIAQRFLTFPSELFERVFKELLLNLPPCVVADLYGRRWRIEEAFNTVKRLLGLSYLCTGSVNGTKLQMWGTWLFYAVLVDLGDAVADELSLPFDRISLEMIYRGLYHFHVAHHKSLAANPVTYFAAPENQDLGIVKTVRKPNVKLIIAPFPDSMSRTDNFFFDSSLQARLTSAIAS